MWSEPRDGFEDHEVAIVEGIADQIGTGLSATSFLRLSDCASEALFKTNAEDRIIGQAPAIRRGHRACVERSGHADSVLIQGESGTGKELLANFDFIQQWPAKTARTSSELRGYPETLLESELFGHEKGAFTDARAAVADA